MAGWEEESSNPVEEQIFILSGQSNMAGRGGVTKDKKWDWFVPPECLPNPSILRFTARSAWEEAHDPLHADIDTSKPCGVGPGMPFANAVLAHNPSTIGAVGLVPCAVGGTAIVEWKRGAHLYQNMVRRAKEARESGGQIQAVLWYQGESDTGSHDAAEAYKARMEQLIRDVRSDLKMPSLPIIQVAIASGDGRFIEIVREAQLGINLPNVVCVDAKGLQLKEDQLHLTTEAQVELGNMLADAYIKHFSSSCL